jgi:NSS family neurotransmitter:Na+ symporter
MDTKPTKEGWNSRVGVILAVTGSAVGLGNFLRFPGKAAANGGGAFLIPYLIAFLLIGLPLAWAEWALGRHGGARGHNSAPGIFRSVIGTRWSSYLGMLGTVMPVLIFTYYLFVEAWCLAYAWDYLTGAFVRLGGDTAAIGAHFEASVGAGANGVLFAEMSPMFLFMLICFVLNFALIYRGVSRGIEAFCNIAMPLLVVCALIVLVRVLTLPPHPLHPEQNILNGLGYMWNPVQAGSNLWETLAKPEIWLEATGQIFFSMSLGFGLILTYASYLKPKDDVCLSSLTSAAGNGFCELVLGGMIAIPAAFVFLGPAVVQSPPGTFGMGFVTLPNVFNEMPAGQFFGFLFFFLLFLAAVTSSLSMLQPAIALLEEGLGLTRKPSVVLLGFICLSGTLFVMYFSKGFLALDTVDFWMANFFIFIFATLQALVFGWVIGPEKGYKEMMAGSAMHVPKNILFVIRYLSPLYLLAIFALWCQRDLPGRIRAIFKPPAGEPPVVLMSIGFILMVLAFFGFVVARANRRWDKEEGLS